MYVLFRDFHVLPSQYANTTAEDRQAIKAFLLKMQEEM